MSSAAPSAHLTVLAAPAVGHLVTDPSGIYVDATFGRGGHSRLILSRLSARGRLIALDRDPQAAEAAAAITDTRFHFAHTRFSRLSATLAALGVPRLQGLLLDLGVSSPQIDEGQRGFSWRADAPLDMRMDTSRGVTAAEWLSSYGLGKPVARTELEAHVSAVGAARIDVRALAAALPAELVQALTAALDANPQLALPAGDESDE